MGKTFETEFFITKDQVVFQSILSKKISKNF